MRPKGLPKTGGRKKGTPNKGTHLRRQAEEEAKNTLTLETLKKLPARELLKQFPTEFLAQIVTERRTAEQLSKLLWEAQQALEARSWEKTLSLAEEGLERFPHDLNFPDIKFEALLVGLGQVDAAFEFIEGHLPTIWNMPNALAHVLYVVLDRQTPVAGKRMDFARKLSDQILALVPVGKSYEHTWYIYLPVAQCLFEMGDVGQAIQLNAIANTLTPINQRCAFKDYLEDAKAEYLAFLKADRVNPTLA